MFYRGPISDETEYYRKLQRTVIECERRRREHGQRATTLLTEHEEGLGHESEMWRLTLGARWRGGRAGDEGRQRPRNEDVLADGVEDDHGGDDLGSSGS